jgi:hypothetical protein
MSENRIAVDSYPRKEKEEHKRKALCEARDGGIKRLETENVRLLKIGWTWRRTA